MNNFEDNCIMPNTNTNPIQSKTTWRGILNAFVVIARWRVSGLMTSSSIIGHLNAGRDEYDCNSLSVIK